MVIEVDDRRPLRRHDHCRYLGGLNTLCPQALATCGEEAPEAFDIVFRPSGLRMLVVLNRQLALRHAVAAGAIRQRPNALRTKINSKNQ